MTEEWIYQATKDKVNTVAQPSHLVMLVIMCVSFEDLQDSDEEEEEEEEEGRGREMGSWIREVGGEDPVNFLDPGLASRITCECDIIVPRSPVHVMWLTLTSAADPRDRRSAAGQPFQTSAEGKLVISEGTPEESEYVRACTDVCACMCDIVHHHSAVGGMSVEDKETDGRKVSMHD